MAYTKCKATACNQVNYRRDDFIGTALPGFEGIYHVVLFMESKRKVQRSL